MICLMNYKRERPLNFFQICTSVLRFLLSSIWRRSSVDVGPVQFILAEGVGRTYHDCTSAPGEVPEKSKRKDIVRESCP